MLSEFHVFLFVNIEKSPSEVNAIRDCQIVRRLLQECVRMLSTVISATTPFSVRDILSADQEIDSMDCYQNHPQTDIQINNQMQPDYYGYNVIPENAWDMDKLKEQSVGSYQGYGEMNHVHQLSQVVPPYQESPVIEDGECYLKSLISALYRLFFMKTRL